MCNLPQSSNELFERIKKTEIYHKTFCASIDLLGISSLIGKPNTNLNVRLYNLYSGLWAANSSYPMSSNYRICYIGDSIFVIREFTIEEEAQLNLEEEWKKFCGQLYLISSDIFILESHNQNSSESEPFGLRVIISFGKTYEIYRNDLWATQDNWYVCTGPNTALLKCLDAEKKGQTSGFQWNHCFSEIWNNEKKYRGYQLELQEIIRDDLTNKYKEKYEQFFSDSIPIIEL